MPRLRTLWQLARPRGMPLVLALPLTGYGFAHWEWALSLQAPDRMAWVLASWWWLSAGTLWWNAVLDQDEGEVLMGPTVPVPPGLGRWALMALALSVGLGFAAGPVPGFAALLAALMSIGYSHPKVVWKAHPVAGPVVNWFGYGILSPLAGFAVVGAPPSWRSYACLFLLSAWVTSAYFAAQTFQEAEDRARGYRTLVATAGPAATLLAARTGGALAIWGAVGLAALGALPRFIVLALPAWFRLDQHLAAWGAKPARAASGRRFLTLSVHLAALVLTLAALQHGWQVATGSLPAGLGLDLVVW